MVSAVLLRQEQAWRGPNCARHKLRNIKVTWDADMKSIEDFFAELWAEDPGVNDINTFYLRR